MNLSVNNSARIDDLEVRPTTSHEEGLTVMEAVLQRVRLLAERRLLWLSEIEDSIADEDRWSNLPAHLRKVLLNFDSPDDEEQFYQQDERARQLTELVNRYSDAVLDGENPFGRMVDVLGLTGGEADLLQVCLAAQIDPGLSGVYALCDDKSTRGYPNEPLAARICGHGRIGLWSPSGALAQWQLLVADDADPGEAVPLRVDSYIVGYLHGQSELDPEILQSAIPVASRPSLRDWPVEALSQQVSLAHERGLPCRITVVGPQSSGRRTFAANVAETLGSPLLAIDTACIAERDFSRVRVRIQRLALLHGCAIAWHGPHVETAIRGGPVKLPLEFAILEPPGELDSVPGWLETRIDLPRLTSTDRARFWMDCLPVLHAFPAEQRNLLSERYVLQVGEIRQIAAQGVDSFQDMTRLCREHTRGRLGELGTLLHCPFRRSDLQLPSKLSQLLDEFLYEARERVRFWENEKAARLFPRGTGLIALMSGAPGTGKTMAAQVIAAELGLDLFRIDLASMVNKYIGETAKNLRRVFARAAEMNAVLFFDEADSLFSKRTDVRNSNDRHSNADTNYLLQQVEDYPGIALLASNKQQNMDDAFVRRIRYLMYFPRPEAAQRLAIWRQLVSELNNEELEQELAADLERLSHTVDVTGAQIKNATLAAMFIASEAGRRLCLRDIYRGLERELGNQGRSLPTQLDGTGSNT